MGNRVNLLYRNKTSFELFLDEVSVPSADYVIMFSVGDKNASQVSWTVHVITIRFEGLAISRPS